MTRLVQIALTCLVIALVALSLLTVNVIGGQPFLLQGTVEATVTVPPSPPFPPSVTPVGQAFAPIVYDTLSTPTVSPSPTSTLEVEPTSTVPPSPPFPPSVTPVGQAFAPIVYDTLSTPTVSPTPTSTLEVEPTFTVPATPP